MSFEGRIIYNSIYVDFLRKWNEFDFVPRAYRTESISGAGLKQFINFYSQDFITAVLEKLSAQERIELLQWFEYVKDGDSFEIVRDRGLGGFWAFEKTLKNNDETSGTFTRTAGTANNASYINPSDGLLKFEDTADTPRYPEGKFGHGILIEGSRTNICQQSCDFSTTWTTGNITVSTNTSDIADPEGNNIADKLTANANDATITYTTSTGVSTDDGCFSIYLRTLSGEITGRIRIGSGAWAISNYQTFTATPEWQRFQVYHENSGDPGENWAIQIEIDTSGDSVYAYGAQLEVGSDVMFASNLIKTSGSNLTRNAESVYWSTTDLLDSEQGTIAFWFKPEWIYNKHPSTVLFDIYDNTDSTRFCFIEINQAGTLLIHLYEKNDNTEATNTSYGLSAELNQNEKIHFAFTWDTTIDNGLKIYVDGNLKSTSTNDKFAPSQIGSYFYLGDGSAGGFPAYGIFDELLTRKDVLTESKINNIYNYGNGLGEKKNRWSSVILSNPSFVAKQLRGNNLFDFTLEMEEKLS